MIGRERDIENLIARRYGFSGGGAVRGAKKAATITAKRKMAALNMSGSRATTLRSIIMRQQVRRLK
jgi:hypothetical protein